VDSQPGQRRAAVLGQPITHSFSPVLHRCAYAALGLSGWRYDAIECAADDLPARLADSGPEWVGFSCTMPLKRTALALASEARPRAAAVGAANTLLRRDDGWWVADNTDVLGIRAAITERGLPTTTVSLLGAGGTAQAVVAALAELGVGECTAHVRAPERAGELLATARRVSVAVHLRPLADPVSAGLIVSTLPAGAADALAARSWSEAVSLLDVVYSPWPTPLARAITAAGGVAVGGAVILLHQAAAQVELMTGHSAPLEAMRTALRSAAPHSDV
jgi:shikimate dehydrogenase